MLLLRSFCLCLALYSAGHSAVGGPLKASYRIADGGQVRDFVIARDEIHRSRSLRRIPLAPDPDAARAAGQAIDGELILYPAGAPKTAANRRLLTKRLAVRLAPGVDAAALADSAGSRLVSGPRGENWYVIEALGGAGAALEALEKLRPPDVLQAQPMLARQQQKRRSVNDPLFGQQWHLLQANVPAAWDTATGSGVTIAIVDDGLQHSHPDLAPNYSSADSYDFNRRDPDPEPPSYFFDIHGTACAGVAAAAGSNALGGAGVAYSAGLSGLRLISAPTTDEEEAEAFAFHNDTIAIKSNSWGPPDDGRTTEGPGPLTLAAIEEAAATGRGGLGTIILFAGGNGARANDNSNFDGYANRREIIAVGAVNSEEQKAAYSEPGTNLLVSAPSSGGLLSVVTTDSRGDDGYNRNGKFGDLPDIDYTNTFGGTSSACPLTAGVAALMLQRNPGLGWRDVQEILVQTAKMVEPSDHAWVVNGAGFRFNDNFGAGGVDAAAAVAKAANWTNLGPQIEHKDHRPGLATPIPDNRPAGVEFTFNVATSNLRVEHAHLAVEITHARRGQLEITLTSPAGTVSRLAPQRPRDKGANYFWRFMSTHHWGEMAAGNWKVQIADGKKGSVGVVHSLTLELSGSAPSGGLVAGAPSVSFIPQNGLSEVDFSITNQGKLTLTGLQAAFVNSPAATGSAMPGTVGSLAPGETKIVRVAIQTQGTVGTDLRPTLMITGDNVFTQSIRYKVIAGRVATQSFTSIESISTPSIRKRATRGLASPYPSSLQVGGLPHGAVLVDVKLRLRHFVHSRSSDVDALLVSPSGKKVIPMSDAGFASHDVEVTLSDGAKIALPETSLIGSGSYRPANYGKTFDRFPKPAPLKPYDFSFAAFSGDNPTGTWHLFLVDDKSRFLGSLGGWSLDITYATPF